MTNPTPLPALPEPGVNIPAGDWTNITDSHYYTDTQMRTYAESAIAALGSSMPSGEADDECPHGDAHLVNDCLRCGAPVCCGKCCAEDAARPAGPLDANALELMAKERPNDMFLKGSGVLKLIGGIRQLEGEIRRMKAATPKEATKPTAAVQGGLTELAAKVKEAIKLSDTVGRSRGSNCYAMNSGAVAKLVDLEGEITNRFAALSANAGSQQSEPVALKSVELTHDTVSEAARVVKHLLADFQKLKARPDAGNFHAFEGLLCIFAQDLALAATPKEAKPQSEPVEDFVYLQKKLSMILQSVENWSVSGFSRADTIRGYVRDLQDEYATPKEAGSQPTSCYRCGKRTKPGDVHTCSPKEAGSQPVTPGYGDYARWAEKAGAKVNHDGMKPRITFDSMSDWRAFCDTVNSVISDRPTAAGAVPTDADLNALSFSYSWIKDDEFRFDHLGYARAVLALAAPADGKAQQGAAP